MVLQGWGAQSLHWSPSFAQGPAQQERATKPGYAGSGGRGGNYLGTLNGQYPELDSGGGRGGDSDGVPTSFGGLIGEGTGLLGRSPDKTTSLGPKLFGAGAYWAGAALNGGVRLVWNGARTYPDNVPDVPDTAVADFVSAASGSSAAFTFHTDAEPGDVVVLIRRFDGSGTVGEIEGSDHWANINSLTFWKQVTQDDIDASAAGIITIGGTVGGWASATYRGARAVRLGSTAFGSDPSLTLPGLTKRSDSKRVIAAVSDQDASTGISVAGFTERVEFSPGGANISVAIADKAPADYVDGSTVGVSTGLNPVAQLFEIY